MLNALWLGFFLTATVAALAQWLLAGNAQVFAAMVQADSARWAKVIKDNHITLE